jgi:hypothetical protein
MGGKSKSLRLYLVVPGILMALSGFVFTLQGVGVVGPSTSFMFRSTTWVVDGLVFFVIGLLLTVGGLWKGRRGAGG